MSEINFDIGKKLKELRTSRSLKLEDISNLTGVSKAMISQIERGKTIPSVTTLWKLSTGLKVSFSYFVESEEEELEIKRIEDIEPIEDEDGLILYPVYPFDIQSGLEIFMIKLKANCRHKSESHNNNIVEYITVLKGSLVLRYGEKEYVINESQSLKFNGNTPHQYINKTNNEIVFQNIIMNQ